MARGDRVKHKQWKPHRYHKATVKVHVWSTKKAYRASACIGPTERASTRAAYPHQNCSRVQTGLTPRSATAKALKNLAQTVAKRGRVNIRTWRAAGHTF